MPDLRFQYFDFDGGRGEVPRLVMSLGEIPFEDLRIAGADWPTLRETAPFHALPVLEIDGEAITQSNSINRYLGRMASLYPDEPLEALRCDEIMDAIEDISARIGSTFGIGDEAEKRAAREQLADGPISLYLGRLQEILAARGGEFFADNRLTIADLKVMVWMRWLRSGTLDYIPADLPDRLAPELVAHCERVARHPGIVAYYEDR